MFQIVFFPICLFICKSDTQIIVMNNDCYIHHTIVSHHYEHQTQLKAPIKKQQKIKKQKTKIETKQSNETKSRIIK
jgi:hypothetical protein